MFYTLANYLIRDRSLLMKTSEGSKKIRGGGGSQGCFRLAWGDNCFKQIIGDKIWFVTRLRLGWNSLKNISYSGLKYLKNTFKIFRRFGCNTNLLQGKWIMLIKHSYIQERMSIQLFLSIKVKFKYSCGSRKPSSRLIAFPPYTFISQASKNAPFMPFWACAYDFSGVSGPGYSKAD